MKVTVLMGGWSTERQVSLWSGEQVAAALEKCGIEVTQFDLTQQNVKELINCKSTVVFNALHGTGGEDGLIQGFMDAIGITYTHSGLLASAVAMDKPMTKVLAAAAGIQCAEGVTFDTDFPKSHPYSPPYVVKPSNQGSTIGIRIIKSDNEPPCGEGDWEFNAPILVERYIPGLELSVGVIDGKAIDVIEIEPVSEFYDFQAKYDKEGSKHHLPARIPANIRQAALTASESIWRILGCRDVARVDFRYDPEHEGDSGLYMLEVNTHPGLTATSLLPEMAAAHGISFSDLVLQIVNFAAKRGPYLF